MSLTIDPPQAAEPAEPAESTDAPVNESSRLSVKVLGSVALFAVFMAKAYGVAGYSLTTTTALVTSTPLAIVIGTVALYTYAFAALAAVVGVALFIGGFVKQYRDQLRPLMPVTGVIAVFAILLSPWRFTVDAAVVGAIVPACYGLLHALRSRTSLHAVGIFIGGLALVLFLLATLSTPWVPAEIVTLKQPIVTNPVIGAQSLARKPVAFVLDDSNGWTRLLIADDRYLAIVPQQDIASQQICHYNDQFPGSEPLFETLTGKAYSPHDLACFRLTDQSDRLSFVQPPLVVRLLTWSLG
jgi:hypothetical protein